LYLVLDVATLHQERQGEPLPAFLPSPSKKFRSRLVVLMIVVLLILFLLFLRVSVLAWFQGRAKPKHSQAERGPVCSRGVHTVAPAAVSREARRADSDSAFRK
jgi:hypothetical protein